MIYEKDGSGKKFFQILEKNSVLVYNGFDIYLTTLSLYFRKADFTMDMLEVIKEILSKQLKVDVDTIDESTNIVADLGADSLDVVEMLMTIEEEYGVVVPDEAVADFVTVGDVARYVENNQE